jgi:hypothetical protein
MRLKLLIGLVLITLSFGCQQSAPTATNTEEKKVLPDHLGVFLQEKGQPQRELLPCEVRSADTSYLPNPIETMVSDLNPSFVVYYPDRDISNFALISLGIARNTISPSGAYSNETHTYPSPFHLNGAKEVPTMTKPRGEGLYELSPRSPLDPAEKYAVVYAGTNDVWCFAMNGTSGN